MLWYSKDMNAPGANTLAISLAALLGENKYSKTSCVIKMSIELSSSDQFSKFSDLIPSSVTLPNKISGRYCEDV